VSTGKSSLTISAKPAGVGGCVSAIDSSGRPIWIADAHRDDGKRFVVRADEKLTAFVELERVTRESFRFSRRENVVWREFQI
jgi:hypothetical protein